MVAGMIFCGLSSFLFFERLFLIIWKLLSKKKVFFEFGNVYFCLEILLQSSTSSVFWNLVHRSLDNSN